jgi:hypothetical protein
MVTRAPLPRKSCGGAWQYWPSVKSESRGRGCVVYIVVFALGFISPEYLSGQNKSSLSAAFLIGKFWRESDKPVLAGVDVAFGTSAYRPTVSILAGDGAGEVGIGFLGRLGPRHAKVFPVWGVGITARNIETL